MGRAIAIGLAKAGANVAVGSLMNKAEARSAEAQRAVSLSQEDFDSLRAELESHGIAAMALDLDVCSSESVQEFHRAATQRLGEIDVLVNAAGTFMFHHYVAGHPDDYWFRTIDVNLHGPYRTIKACLPSMIERKWGRIVNLASTAANVGADDHAAYCASKSGLLGLTRCVALEGAPHGVTCNAINPGFVASPQNFIRLEQKIAMEGSDLTVEQYRQKIAESYPQKRFVTCEEIAELCLFFCRDLALGVTGEDVTVAGGSLW